MSNAFESPAHDEPMDEVDLGSAKPPLLGVIAGVFSMLAGATAATTALQFFTMIHLRDWWAWPLPYLMVIIALLTVFAGGASMRARAGGAVFGMFALPAFTVFWLAFFLYTSLGGLFSLVCLLALILTAFATVLHGVALVPVMKAARARKALYA